MRIKKGVIIAGLAIEMRPVLIAAEEVWKKEGIVTDVDGTEIDLAKEGVTITSGLDGVHSAGSYHYYGYAVDLRTRYFTSPGRIIVIADRLRAKIKQYALKPINTEYAYNDDRRYEVVIEKSHIHVHYVVEV